MYIGLDIGGTKILGALIDPAKKIINTYKEKTNAINLSADQITANIIKIIKNLSENHKIKGIGLGIPGNINSSSGVVEISPNLPFSGYPLKQKLTDIFQVPIALENDVNAGLLGEHWIGSAQGLKNVVSIYVGTGIGGAIIIDNVLLRGKHNIAGEIGHMKLKLGGPACNCGQTGCFEALASKIAIQRALEKQGYTFDAIIKSSFIKAELANNNKAVKTVIKKVSFYIGEAVGSVNNLLNPDAIILGGGIMESLGDYFLKRIRPVANRRALSKPVIRLSSLGDNSVVYGAIKPVFMD